MAWLSSSISSFAVSWRLLPTGSSSWKKSSSSRSIGLPRRFWCLESTDEKPPSSSDALDPESSVIVAASLCSSNWCLGKILAESPSGCCQEKKKLDVLFVLLNVTIEKSWTINHERQEQIGKNVFSHSSTWKLQSCLLFFYFILCVLNYPMVKTHIGHKISSGCRSINRRFEILCSEQKTQFNIFPFRKNIYLLLYPY